MFKYAFLCCSVLFFVFHSGCNPRGNIILCEEDPPPPGCVDGGVEPPDGGLGGTGGYSGTGGAGGAGGVAGSGGVGTGGVGGLGGEGGQAGSGGTGGVGAGGVGGAGGAGPECITGEDCTIIEVQCTCTSCYCGKCTQLPLGVGPGVCHDWHKGRNLCPWPFDTIECHEHDD